MMRKIKNTAEFSAVFLLKSTINLIKPQSFQETRYATLVTIRVFINKCCNVYVFYIPQKNYKKSFKLFVYFKYMHHQEDVCTIRGENV